MRKLVGLFAVSAILVAACGGTSATQAPASTAPSRPPGERGSPVRRGTVGIGDTGESISSGRPTAEPATAEGGTVIIGDWQEATQFNPYYFAQVTEGNVSMPNSFLRDHDHFKYTPQIAAEPIPTTENGGVTLPGDNGDG